MRLRVQRRRVAGAAGAEDGHLGRAEGGGYVHQAGVVADQVLGRSNQHEGVGEGCFTGQVQALGGPGGVQGIHA